MVTDSPSHHLLVEKVGLDPSRKDLAFFQSWKALPVLVGQYYRVRLEIKNLGDKPLHNVCISLCMWTREHGSFKPHCEDFPTIPNIPANESRVNVYSEFYLMRDTGASDLEVQACADGKRLILQYLNGSGETLVYVYHVEPWRSAVLAVAISVAAILVALASWLGPLLPAFWNWLRSYLPNGF